MAEKASDLAYARDLLRGMGAVETRRMFGGAGLYLDGLMFGLVDDGRIYLKVDEGLKAALAEEGAEPWVYVRDGAPQATSYWSLPDSACDDPDEAAAWGRRAHAIALAKKSEKPARRRKKMT